MSSRPGTVLLGVFLVLTATTLSLTSPLQAQRGLQKFRTHEGRRIPNQYIVVFDERAVPLDAPVDAVAAVADELAAVHGGRRRHVYSRALTGFSVALPEPAARRLSEDPRVAYVEEDGVTFPTAVQTGVPNWGLDRIDQRVARLDDTYHYFADGTGVNVYVVDTGVFVNHPAFEGRAEAVFDNVGDGLPLGTDCYGHGTHVAGIAASEPYGVAKNAHVLAVRTNGCDGFGPWSNIVDALDWIVAHHVKPAVVNMSLGGGLSTAANDAIGRVTAAGILFVGAAGNNAEDACNETPGSAVGALTVGNAGDDDQPASTSNYGPCVDIYAPGEGIASTMYSDGTAWMYGTSQASPHVAGAAALYLERHPTATPDEVRQAILGGATRNVLSGLVAGTPNLLLFTSHLGDNIPPTVALTSPAASAAVSGSVNVAATAADNSEVSSVRFLVGQTEIGRDQTAPYAVTWATSGIPNAAYTVRAIATDLAGNSSQSSVQVTVLNGADVTAPSVQITSPRDTATVGGTVTLLADAFDNIAVSKVEFLIDGKLFGADTSKPYSVVWDSGTTIDGAHTITARAVDTSSNAAVSARVTVHVNNAPAGALPTGWTADDVGAVGSAGAAGYNGSTFTIRAAGTDIWASADAFHFVHRSWTGDGEIVARVYSLPRPTGAAFALGGIMFRDGVLSNVRHAALLVSTDGKVKFRRRTVAGGATLSDGPSAGSTSVPHWLKVTRKGNVFTAYHSVDAAAWIQAGPATTIAMPATLQAGIWALRNGDSGLVTASLTNVSVNVAGQVLPPGWTSDDIGTTGTPGTASYAAATFTLRGGGADVWSTADAFQFVHRTWTGDGDLIARLASLSSPAGAAWAMGGIMIRNGLASNAQHAALLVSTDGKLKFRRRLVAGGATLSNGPSTGTTAVPRWLKLSRRTTTVTAFSSTDGVTWTPVYVPQTIAFPDSVEVGMWTLRNGGTGVSQSAFSNVGVTRGP
jgi:hypothetical protein